MLTHKDLYLHPVAVRLPRQAMAGREGTWAVREELGRYGVPAPVQRLLAQDQEAGR